MKLGMHSTETLKGEWRSLPRSSSRRPQPREGINSGLYKTIMSVDDKMNLVIIRIYYEEDVTITLSCLSHDLSPAISSAYVLSKVCNKKKDCTELASSKIVSLFVPIE